MQVCINKLKEQELSLRSKGFKGPVTLMPEDTDWLNVKW